MAKSDWIAQGMAESAAWRQGIRNLINASETSHHIHVHNVPRAGYLFKQEATVCDMCAELVLQNVLGCKTVYVCVCVCVPVSVSVHRVHRAKFQDVIFSTLKA